MSPTWRFAGPGDVPLLAEWNHQLIRDEGHRNPMSVGQLEERMRGWLAGDYKAVLFEGDGAEVGYALFKHEPGAIYLRQMFIRRELRRKGHGRRGFEILRKEVWPGKVRLTVDVLVRNETAIAFWRAVGYRDYCLTLEIPPEESP